MAKALFSLRFTHPMFHNKDYDSDVCEKKAEKKKQLILMKKQKTIESLSVEFSNL